MSVATRCEECHGIVIQGSGWHPFLNKYGCADQPNQPLGWSAEDQLSYHAMLVDRITTDLVGKPTPTEEQPYLRKEADLVLTSRSQAEWWAEVVQQRESWPEFKAFIDSRTKGNP